MDIISVSSFNNRSELENHIRSLVGLSVDDKPDYQIQGTGEELRKLQLSSKTTFWGIKCVETDFINDIKVVEKPQRGEKKDFNLK